MYSLPLLAMRAPGKFWLVSFGVSWERGQFDTGKETALLFLIDICADAANKQASLCVCVLNRFKILPLLILFIMYVMEKNRRSERRESDRREGGRERERI